MLWIKAFHLFFAICWFAALFYLPRILVNLAEERESASRERLQGMALRLYRFGSILMLLALFFGIWLLVLLPHFLVEGWLHVKILLLVLLIGYHHLCRRYLRQLEAGVGRSPKFYRWFNEVPALFLLAILLLAILRPF